MSFIEELKVSPNGKSCPCCSRYAKVYRRALTSTITKFLVWLAVESGDGNPWLHPEQHMESLLRIVGRGNLGGDPAKLRYWGLIEAKAEPGEDCPHSGFWRITEKGKQFVKGETTVPAKALVLFGDCIGFDGEHINIQQAMRTRFSFSELMAEAA